MVCRRTDGGGGRAILPVGGCETGGSLGEEELGSIEFMRVREREGAI